MINTTQVSYFIFTAYFELGLLKYLVFVIIMCLYILITCSNLLLIVVICVNRSLHEPMYMFLCSLFVNELYGSTAFFPFFLLQILSDIHTVSASFCYLQMFCFYTNANIYFYNLAVMSYDRYLAICCPLQYNTRMTFKKITILISVSWLFPFLVIAVFIYLNTSLQLCGNFVDKMYCDYVAVVKLACSDTTVIDMYELVYTFTVIAGLATVIFYTYMRILKVCFSGSKQTRQKAIRTCTPHLISLLHFAFGCIFELSESRVHMTQEIHMVAMFFCLYFLTCQPLFITLMYGLNLPKIRIMCKSLVLGKT